MNETAGSTSDRRLRKAIESVDLATALRPTNVAEELRAFRAGTRRAPQLAYASNDATQAPISDVADRGRSDAPHEIVSLVQEKFLELGRLERLIAAVGTEDFTAASVAIYGRPSAQDVQDARGVLEQWRDVGRPEPVRDAAALAQALRERLGELAIDLLVIEDPILTTEVAVNAATRTIRIRPDLRCADIQIARLVVHEVDVHAVRIHNGAQTPWSVLELGSAGYLETEEGLAVHRERETGTLYPYQAKLYAARCLAVDVALSEGFSAVFEELRPYLDDEVALGLAFRVKRGLADTSRPGALTKESHYFSGPRRIQGFVADGGSLDTLYGAKIALEHVPQVEALVSRGLIDSSMWRRPA